MTVTASTLTRFVAPATAWSGTRPSVNLVSALSFVLVLFLPTVCHSEKQVPSSAPHPGKGWRYRVVAEKLPEVDDLAVGADGSLYATQHPADAKGRVVRVRNGRIDTIVDELDQPGGVLVIGHHLYVTEKINEGRLIKLNLKDGHRRVYGGLNNPEHIAWLSGSDVLVSEDVLSGRVTRVSRDGATEVIASGFNSIEGLSVARDGTIFIGESGTGRVLTFKDGVLNVVVDDLDSLGQIECAADGSVWITEDSSSGRLLRLKDGVLETVMSGLVSPQGIALGENGAVFVVEGGRSRILNVEPKP